MSLKLAIFAALAATTIWFVWTWWRLSRKSLPNVPDEKKHTWYHAPVAFVMCFFDTLGLGNFATTTAAFKFRNTVPDEKIPGTLNVGYALQTIAQAFIYIAIIQVDIWTLVLMIAASVAGAWLGAGVVCHWPRKKIRIGMGFALLGAATLLFLTLQGIAPGGGTNLSLQGVRLGLGLAGNFALGALMTLGIGLYAPCLILVSLLGMSPAAAFPIMMGSCAFLMPVGGIRFIKEGSYAPWTAVVMSIAGIPAVLIAAKIVGSMDLTTLRWLVLVVVLYTAALMLRSAFTEKPSAPATQAKGAAIAD